MSIIQGHSQGSASGEMRLSANFAGNGVCVVQAYERLCTTHPSNERAKAVYVARKVLRTAKEV